jgi:hypothetical protein
MPITITEGSEASGALLTTLARIKARLGITGSAEDARLTQLATTAGLVTESWCGRAKYGFSAQSVADRHSPRGPTITLRHWPVQYVTRIAKNPVPALKITYAHATNVLAEVRTTATGIILTERPSGTATSLAYADYATVTLMAAAIGAVSGFDCEVENDLDGYASSWLVTKQGAFAATVTTADTSDMPAYLYLFKTALPFDLIDPEYGQIIVPLARRGEGALEARYHAGYDSTPEDVQEGVAAIAAALYRRGSRDQSLMHEKIGDYSYTHFQPTQLAASGFVDSDASILLEAYRRPRV